MVGTPLVDALSYAAKKAHRCYDRALAIDPKVRGKVTIRVRLGSDGSVCEARGEGEGAMQSVADCAAEVYRTSALPPPNGGCADVVVPINFVPRPDDAGAPP